MAAKARRVKKTPIVRIALRRKFSMVTSYISARLKEQLGPVAFISLYLLLFQLLILRSPIQDLPGIIAGIFAVVVGLACFMEGLFLGIMPLGERCGLRLPVKLPLFILLLFAALLGLTATLAEPAISLLRQQGNAVKPWTSPLLYYLLNDGSTWLIVAVAVGVALAVVLGVLRFLRGWPIKLFIFIILPLVLLLSVLAWLDPVTRSVVGLAWDTGGVTTGPVTVPLILALGVGVSRLTGSGDRGTGGLGLVTLASALPVGGVLALALLIAPAFPAPSAPAEFFSPKEREAAVRTLGSISALEASALEASTLEVLPKELVSAYFPKDELINDDSAAPWSDADEKKTIESQALSLSHRALIAALSAILPLALVLIAAMKLLVREKLGHADEIALGLFLSLAGFFLFTIGMEKGLTALGSQAGLALPRAWQPTERPDLSMTLSSLPSDAIISLIDQDGKPRSYFAMVGEGAPAFIPFDPANYDSDTGAYIHIPIDYPPLDQKGGYLLVLLFVFVMGLGATFAEPSLGALGKTLEELTTGTYRSSFLLMTVSIGVGVGMVAGFARILFDLPFLPMLGGLYTIALILTVFTPADIGAIAWDSAGVTTGPITVPLVMAAGLGIGSYSVGVESFGVLALASVCPIISVLISGIVNNLSRSRLRQRTEEGFTR